MMYSYVYRGVRATIWSEPSGWYWRFSTSFHPVHGPFNSSSSAERAVRRWINEH